MNIKSLKKITLKILVMAIAIAMFFSSSVIANTEEFSATSEKFKLVTPVSEDSSLNYTEISNTI